MSTYRIALVLAVIAFAGVGCPRRTPLTPADLPPQASAGASADAAADAGEGTGAAERTAPCRGQVAPACPSPLVPDCKDGRWVCVGPAEPSSGGEASPAGIAVPGPSGTAVGAAVEAEGAAKLASYYTDYSAEGLAAALAEGRPVVLYFWAGWCPICRAEEPNIKAWIGTSPLGVAGFRVNFDTEGALKKTFRVPYQHTTIFLDASGTERDRSTGPMTEAEFRAAIEAAAR